VSPRLIAVALLLLTATSSCGEGNKPKAGSPTRPSAPSERRTESLKFRLAGRLPAPVQLPATTGIAGGRVLAIGGLSAADTSTDQIFLLGPSRSARAVGHLPAPLHDSGAATVVGRTYLFGGGNVGSSADILEITRRGRTSSVSRLPVGASDISAASIAYTAYIVGGYTGTRPLRTILAFTPGKPVHVVAHLPRPLRYAAVAAVGNVVLIAGGTSGTAAQRAVLRFDPRSGRVTRIGELAKPLTHAAGAGLGGRFYVIGGRGDAVDSASAAVRDVDPVTGRVRSAGRLPIALSDVGAANGLGGIVVVGGRDSAGRVHDEVLISGKVR
jgi:hypothetical protein